MEALGQYLANGLFAASVYALLALGMTLIFGVLRVGDLAQGGLFAAGAFATFALTQLWGWSYALAVPAAALLGAGLSVANGRWVYGRLKRLGIGPTFVAAVALLVIYRGLLALGFGWNPLELASPFGAAVVGLGGVQLEAQKALMLAISALAAAGLWAFLAHTRWGRALRALAQNEEAAATLGIPVVAAATLAFALAGALAAATGALLAPVWPFDPGSGTLLALKAFAIAVIARARLGRALAVGVVVGCGEVLIQAYGSAEWSDLFPFALLAAALALRPQSLSAEAEAGPLLRPRLPVVGGAWRRWAWGAALLLAVGVPWLGFHPFVLHLLILLGIWVLLVSGLDLLTGHAGIPSLAQAGLWGVGAYSAALLAQRWGWSFPFSALGAVGVTLLVALGVGWLGLRLRGRWTSFTFLVGIVITLVLEGANALTGGTHGLVGVPPVRLEGVGVLNPFRDKAAYYHLVLIVMAVALWLKQRVVAARLGSALAAVREDEALARAVGVPTWRVKLQAFLISAAFAGTAGALYAHYAGYLHPQLFAFGQSFQLFMMNVLGGQASLLGSLLGPAAIVAFGELTHPIHATLAEVGFSVLLLWALVKLPHGLAGALAGAVHRPHDSKRARAVLRSRKAGG